MAEINFAVDNTALQAVSGLEIKANFEETKNALKEWMEPYESVIVTEDALPVAKKDRARIRKVHKHIDDYRKLVKQTYTQPLVRFEDKCKELTAICTKAADAIDVQIKEYEDRARQKKRERIREYFEQCDKQYPEYHEFERIYNPKWENSTYDMDSIMDEIDREIDKVDTGVKTIVSLKSPYQRSLLHDYKLSGDVLAILDKNQRLIEDEETNNALMERLAGRELKKPAKELAREVTKERDPILFKANIYVQSINERDINEIIDFIESKGLRYLVERDVT